MTRPPFSFVPSGRFASLGSTLIPTLLLTLLPTLLLTPPAAAEPAAKWVVYPGAPDKPGNDKHIVLISGDEEYRSEEAFPMLGKLLSQRHGFNCIVLFSQDEKTGEIDPNNQTNIPGMHLLEDADLVILGLRFRELPDEDMKHFVDYVESGRPIIGIRTSTHAFRYARNTDSPYAKYSFNSREWKGGFGQQVLGDTWISHHGAHKRESTRGVINKQHADHPILNNVEDVWGPTDVYGIRNLPDDAKVLLHGQVLKGMSPDDPPVEGAKNDPMMPILWVRHHNEKTPIVTTTMGSSTDFQSEDLRRAIINAAYWTTGLTVPEKADARIVGSYEPTPYGFNSFKKGVYPSDHTLKPR